MAKKKIDPLNRKQYSAVSAALTVADIPAAVSFYQKAFGFSKRGIMNGLDGKPVHAELTLRGTTLMLGPENPAAGKEDSEERRCLSFQPLHLRGRRGQGRRKSDQARRNTTRSGDGHVLGDRCGNVVDPDGYTWMVGTHKAEPTAKEMKKGMEEMMKQQPSAVAAD